MLQDWDLSFGIQLCGSNYGWNFAVMAIPSTYGAVTGGLPKLPHIVLVVPLVVNLLVKFQTGFGDPKTLSN